MMAETLSEGSLDDDGVWFEFDEDDLYGDSCPSCGAEVDLDEWECWYCGEEL